MALGRRGVKMQLHAMIGAEIIMVIAARFCGYGYRVVEKISNFLAQALHGCGKGQ